MPGFRSDRFMVHMVLFLAVSSLSRDAFAEPVKLAPGVRGVATRAPSSVVIDGDLREFKNAFCTPVGYFERNLRERAAQFFYMWDDQAFYAALRTLDTKQANPAPDDRE